MKIILITLWLAVPLAVAAYHFGPGQELLKGDAAAAHVTDATRSAATGDHKAAIAAYDAALGALPTAAVAESRQLRLARAKERLPNGQLPEAHDELEALFAELTADRDFLNRATTMTGGKLAELDDLASLVNSFGAPKEVLKERRNITLWDKWPLLLAFFGLLTTEWVTRRRSGLV